MQYLASTCKILYDQNTLNCYNEKHIFYKNVEEVNLLVQEFKRELPNMLHFDEPPPVQPGESGWISDYQIKPQHIYRIFESKIRPSISKLTKISNSILNDDFVDILINIIIANLENYMDNETCYFHGYIHINIYNNFIKLKIENTINTVLFGAEGPFTSGDFPMGLLYKKARFTCISCGVHYSIDPYNNDDIIGDGDQYCINCDPN